MTVMLSIRELGYYTTCICYIFCLPKFAQKIGHFQRFYYGPPFVLLRKTAIFDTITKSAII